MNFIDYLLIAIILGCGLIQIICILKPKNQDEIVANTKRLLSNLIPIAPRLVADAEIKFGKGTGYVKKAYVMDELYLRIPDEYKKYVTDQNLSSIIENAVDDAQNNYVFWESLSTDHVYSNRFKNMKGE